MTKKRIAEILKNHGFTMIAKSYYKGENGVIVNAYDNAGDPYNFYVSKYFATMQMFSIVTVHKSYDISDWFKEG